MQATPRKSRPLGLRSQVPGRRAARRAGPRPAGIAARVWAAGAPGPRAAARAGRRAHSPRGRSCPLFRALPTSPGSGVQLAAGGPADGHGATPRRSRPRGSSAAIAFSPARRSHLLFARTRVSNSSVPSAAFVSSFPKFLTPGRSARGRRTAGGTFFPPAGGGRRGARGGVPSLCAPARGARCGPGSSGHKAIPESLSPRERRRGEY